MALCQNFPLSSGFNSAGSGGAAISLAHQFVEQQRSRLLSRFCVDSRRAPSSARLFGIGRFASCSSFAIFVSWALSCTLLARCFRAAALLPTGSNVGISSLLRDQLRPQQLFDSLPI